MSHVALLSIVAIWLSCGLVVVAANGRLGTDRFWRWWVRGGALLLAWATLILSLPPP